MVISKKEANYLPKQSILSNLIQVPKGTVFPFGATQ